MIVHFVCIFRKASPSRGKHRQKLSVDFHEEYCTSKAGYILACSEQSWPNLVLVADMKDIVGYISNRRSASMHFKQISRDLDFFSFYLEDNGTEPIQDLRSEASWCRVRLK
jgi:hypothetical protein